MDDRETLVRAYQAGHLLEAIQTALSSDLSGRTKLTSALASLHNEGHVDLIDAFGALTGKSTSGPDFFLLRHIFEELLPELEAPVPKLIRCVLHLYREAGTDLAAGTILDPFREFCARRADRPKAALAEIEADPKTLAGLLVPVLIAGSTVDAPTFALRSHGHYPSTLGAYGDLLAHPKRRDDEYRKEVTAGSILYPLIAVWAALLDEHEVYEEIAALKRELLSHCTFQYWFPDESTEAHLYIGGGPHGATLTDVCVDRPEADLLDQLFSECEAAPYFEELSAVKFGWWPLVVVACRHHRLPLPLHLLRPLRRKSADTAGGEVAGEDAAI